MTALQAAEVWRDRFLEIGAEAEDDAEATECFVAVVIFARLYEGLERIRVIGGKAS